MKPAPFEYYGAGSAAEAVDLLAQHGDGAKVLAGGQSLVPMLNLRLARPSAVIDINGASDLDDLREAGGVLSIGAIVRQRRLERWAHGRAPIIAEALRLVGHVAIRNRGTSVGNLAHGDPASELPALLLCLDGSVVAKKKGGERVIRAADLYLAPLTTSLEADELVTEARFTLPPAGAGWGFAEVARRHGDFALAGCAALLWLGRDRRVEGCRLGFFGVGGTPVRGSAGEAAMAGQEATQARIKEAARAAAADLSPDGDLHATGEYRRRVAEVLAERTLTSALERCGGRA